MVKKKYLKIILPLTQNIYIVNSERLLILFKSLSLFMYD